MPRAVNETTLSLLFNKVDGSVFRINLPAPRPDLTSEEVQDQMDAILEIAELFDIVSIQGAATTQRIVTPFHVS